MDEADEMDETMSLGWPYVLSGEASSDRELSGRVSSAK